MITEIFSINDDKLKLDSQKEDFGFIFGFYSCF